MSGTDVRYGVWATLGEPRTAAALTGSGLDWAVLDQQHGHFDDRAMREAYGLTTGRSVPLLVRVRANDAGLIGRVLDAGGDGVIVPLVDSAEDAARAVAAAHHPPRGTRSWGFLPDTARTDRVPFVAVMIETAEALAAVEEIAAVPGVDMLFVGPFDLSLRLGTTVDALLADSGADAPLPRVLAAAAKAGLIAGAFGAEPARAAVLASLGFSWVIVTTDAGLLAAGHLQRDLAVRAD
ncbi:MAG TPA: aldolase/citrate lyase family protein [Amnibacterium sp.]|uniref:HpcH/HpaI aldolase family protein n=1 Tax=Amnibacterium sp. TaxID=1872496 RepID=UPI002F921FAF